MASAPGGAESDWCIQSWNSGGLRQFWRLFVGNTRIGEAAEWTERLAMVDCGRWQEALRKTYLQGEVPTLEAMAVVRKLKATEQGARIYDLVGFVGPDGEGSAKRTQSCATGVEVKAYSPHLGTSHRGNATHCHIKSIATATAFIFFSGFRWCN